MSSTPFTTEAIGANSDLMQCLFQQAYRKILENPKYKLSQMPLIDGKGYLTDFSFWNKNGNGFCK